MALLINLIEIVVVGGRSRSGNVIDGRGSLANSAILGTCVYEVQSGHYYFRDAAKKVVWSIVVSKGTGANDWIFNNIDPNRLECRVDDAVSCSGLATRRYRYAVMAVETDTHIGRCRSRSLGRHFAGRANEPIISSVLT